MKIAMQLSIVLAIFVVSLHLSNAFRTSGHSRMISSIHSRNTVKGSKLWATEKEKEDIPENETEDEMLTRLRKKARRMMFNEKGVAYAPWMSKQVDEDAIVQLLIKKEKGDTKKKAASILDRGEIESSEGMKWRMTGNQVELAWVTSEEPGNRGYLVEKRPSYGGDFQEVASYNDVIQLRSKGISGGRYRYLDPSTSPGSWIYRIRDNDEDGAQNVLCQCFVEVQTESESKTQIGIAVGLVGLLGGLFAAGYALDPPL